MTWTSADVTKYMDEYFAARPQFDPPNRGILGYDVPLPIAAVLHSMLMELENARSTSVYNGEDMVGMSAVDMLKQDNEQLQAENKALKADYRVMAHALVDFHNTAKETLHRLKVIKSPVKCVDCGGKLLVSEHETCTDGSWRCVTCAEAV